MIPKVYMCECWIGYSLVSSANSQFLSKVMEKFPKDTDIIVACQKGLR